MTPKESQFHVFDSDGREVKVVADMDAACSWADHYNGCVIETIPHQIILVDHVPACNFCGDPNGEYDFPTVMGPWANACENCWPKYRVSARLGTGSGQKWVQRPEVKS